MTLIANRYNSHRNEERPRLLFLAGAVHPRVWQASAALAAAEEWQILHTATPVAVVPSWEPYRGDIQIAVLDAGRGIPMLGRKPEGLHAQPRLETLLDDAPLWGTGVFGKRPSIETGHHQRLIPWEVDHRPNAKRADKL